MQVFNYTESEKDQLASIQQGQEILTTTGLHETWQKRRQTMLKDKIDVTAFLVWFIEHYPESAKLMRNKQDRQKTTNKDYLPFRPQTDKKIIQNSVKPPFNRIFAIGSQYFINHNAERPDIQ